MFGNSLLTIISTKRAKFSAIFSPEQQLIWANTSSLQGFSVAQSNLQIWIEK